MAKNIQLFKNPVLEKLTHVHPVVPFALWAPLIVYWFIAERSALTSTQIASFAIAGFFVWTLAEYILHRFIFHFKPRGKLQERISFLIHGIHHEDPEDATRLLMPPVAALALAAVFYLLFMMILGPINVKPFFSGFIFGYLCYDYIHFATHYFRPKSRFLKALKQNHMNHHFVSPDKHYGLSSPLWDYFFGTNH